MGGSGTSAVGSETNARAHPFEGPSPARPPGEKGDSGGLRPGYLDHRSGFPASSCRPILGEHPHDPHPHRQCRPDQQQRGPRSGGTETHRQCAFSPWKHADDLRQGRIQPLAEHVLCHRECICQRRRHPDPSQRPDALHGRRPAHQGFRACRAHPQDHHPAHRYAGLRPNARTGLLLLLGNHHRRQKHAGEPDRCLPGTGRHGRFLPRRTRLGSGVQHVFRHPALPHRDQNHHRRRADQYLQRQKPRLYRTWILRHPKQSNGRLPQQPCFVRTAHAPLGHPALRPSGRVRPGRIPGRNPGYRPARSRVRGFCRIFRGEGLDYLPPPSQSDSGVGSRHSVFASRYDDGNPPQFADGLSEGA